MAQDYMLNRSPGDYVNNLMASNTYCSEELMAILDDTILGAPTPNLAAPGDVGCSV